MASHFFPDTYKLNKQKHNCTPELNLANNVGLVCGAIAMPKLFLSLKRKGKTPSVCSGLRQFTKGGQLYQKRQQADSQLRWIFQLKTMFFFLEIEIVLFYTVVNSSKQVFRKVSKIYFCANDVRLSQSAEKMFDCKRRLRTLPSHNYTRVSRTSLT